MSGDKIEWTSQQLSAILRRNSDILVTASAGTGKTAVLSGRCANIIQDKGENADIKSILVLTFTEAAAEQMKARIAQYLNDEFLKTKDRNLKHQLLLLQGADISTIHSFCKRIITENFYKLGLDPTFRMLDEDEQQLLKSEILEKTIDWAWRQPELAGGLRKLLYKRSLEPNTGFTSKIVHLHNFLENVVSRENWFKKAETLIQSPPFQTELAEEQKRLIKEKLNESLNQIKHAHEIYQKQSSGENWNIDNYTTPLRQLIETFNRNNWDDFINAIQDFKKPRTSKPNNIDENIAEFLKNTVKDALDTVRKLTDLATVNPDYLNKINPAVNLQTKVLLKLLKKFDKLYQNTKKSINALDFSDLEHNALRLLIKETDDSKELSPSETALAIRKRYKHIFVDEYQDINPPQQKILDAISKKDNFFAVGDIKQSIYAFRGAQPQNFLNLLNLSSNDPQKLASCYRVDLNKNFRSQKQILDFVNKIFSRLMTPTFAKIQYDDLAKLSPALKTQEQKTKSPLVELHILDEQQKRQSHSRAGGQELQISSREQQAAAIALRIKQIIGFDNNNPEFEIYDKTTRQYRKPGFRDIAILMRAPAKRVNDYVQILRLAGVNVTSEFGTDYFQATEISDLVSLLKVLDNPRRDIELAATLRSPLFNVTDSELAKIKIHANSKAKNDQNKHEHPPFHQAVNLYAEAGAEGKLKQKIQSILEQIDSWRTHARAKSVAELIWKIYRRTNYLSFVTALPNGQLRKANLLKLHDRAIQFENFTGSAAMASLARFINFLEKLNESGQQWASAEPQSSIKNAVRISSIHKSKGLEFPIVFIAELNSKFNTGKSSDDCIADIQNTVGLKIIDPKSNAKLSSLAHQLISEKKITESLQEELRILYVAATRAEQKLILTATQKAKDTKNILCDGFCLGKAPLPDSKLKNAKNPLQWLLYALSDQRNLHETFKTSLAEEIAKEQNLFSIKAYDQNRLDNLSDFIAGLRKMKLTQKAKTIKKTKPKQKSKLLQQIKQNLSWRYPQSDATMLPAKLSVTQLTHSEDEFRSQSTFNTFAREPAALGDSTSYSLNPLTLGSAYHLLLANIDLSKPPSLTSIEKTKRNLIKQNAVTEDIAESINPETILSFFQSELGQTILKPQNNILREWPFTFALPASKLQNYKYETGQPDAAGKSIKPYAISDKLNPQQTKYETADTIIIQGIIDMLVQTPEGLIIIDFKTDRINKSQAKNRADLYKHQLNLYAAAAKNIMKEKINSSWLYFLALQTPVKIS